MPAPGMPMSCWALGAGALAIMQPVGSPRRVTLAGSITPPPPGNDAFLDGRARGVLRVLFGAHAKVVL